VPGQTYAYVTPSVLRWAREAAGLDLVDAAHKLDIPWFRLEMAEEGEDLLTLRQAERAAEVYDRPLALLSLPEPPQDEPPEAQFRRLPGAPKPPWPAEMRSLARHVRDRQDAAADLYDGLDEEPPWIAVAKRFREVDAGYLHNVARALLGVSVVATVRRVERLGLLVDGPLHGRDGRPGLGSNGPVLAIRRHRLQSATTRRGEGHGNSIWTPRRRGGVARATGHDPR
jgi:hypothetical protein